MCTYKYVPLFLVLTIVLIIILLYYSNSNNIKWITTVEIIITLGEKPRRYSRNKLVF